MKIKIALINVLGLFISSLAGGFIPPSAHQQQQILLTLREEMIRLDGEGLVARKERPQSFIQTTDAVIDEAWANRSAFDFFNSFQKLDGTYTNLHAKAVYHPDLEKEIDIPWYKNQSIWLMAEVEGEKVRLVVDVIEDTNVSKDIEEGDEIVAINGRKTALWLDENFLFCKFPLKTQCARQFESNLLSLRLAWKGNTDLVYTVKHQGELRDVKLKFIVSDSIKNPLRKRCDWRGDKRYPGFKLVHLGFFACLYESEKDPRVGLLRITSFQYNRKQLPENPFNSVQEEVDALEKVFAPRANQYKHLVIDVLDNHGGNAPIPYYQILFAHEFQEQYVRFKKIPELEDPALRKAILWNDPSQELLFQKYFNEGLWDSLKFGEFTPPSPMFCVSDDLPCDQGLFPAKMLGFKGSVHIMVNEGCVSSCDGFVWAVSENLNTKLYGFYQAADSAYSRLRIDIIADSSTPAGFIKKISPERAPLPANFIVGQVVAVSLATDSKGNILSGIPLNLHREVPIRFGEYYPVVVLKEILKGL